MLQMPVYTAPASEGFLPLDFYATTIFLSILKSTGNGC